jgi:hypothetical protein
MEVFKTLRAAIRHLQAGELDQAEDLYREVLELESNQPLALHSLGLIAYIRAGNWKTLVNSCPRPLMQTPRPRFLIIPWA